MEDYVAVMKKDTPDYFFYRAVISIHNGQYPKAMRHILRARDSVDPELCSLFGESYSRAYKFVFSLPPFLSSSRLRTRTDALRSSVRDFVASSFESRCSRNSRRSSLTRNRLISRIDRRR